ncbi:hypothetical protein Poly24_53340 [Rosistilla carotiformis]|uniref:Uncharacterized protein n=1 Tax=Rosistilla carotiformis TaxID=2528017 RepID=A0A518K1F9_9BACT|nr:hypothetical protein Poly24_53340 [Rosistilla carotiformis]
MTLGIMDVPNDSRFTLRPGGSVQDLRGRASH